MFDSLADEIDYLRAENDRLQALLEDQQADWERFRSLGLTKAGCKIINALMRRERVSRDYLCEVATLRDGVNPKVIDTQICRVRRSLPKGARVRCVHGYGYTISPRSKALIENAL